MGRLSGGKQEEGRRVAPLQGVALGAQENGSWRGGWEARAPWQGLVYMGGREGQKNLGKRTGRGGGQGAFV